MADKEKKKKESILDLSKYIDKTIRVKFQGGREGSPVPISHHCLSHPWPWHPRIPSLSLWIGLSWTFHRNGISRCAAFCVWRLSLSVTSSASGILKGFDPLLNLVLDGTIEYMRDPDDQYKLTEDTRQLGLVVCRGTSVVLICPQDGMEAIPNPFIQQQDA
eukprot:XP_016882358.1 U6 snRNA-associated Sm-like protein LSm7 isoform X1 [Homo sapiens]